MICKRGGFMIRGEVCLLYDRVDGLGMVTDGQREASR